jgi:hypothetical protein
MFGGLANNFTVVIHPCVLAVDKDLASFTTHTTRADNTSTDWWEPYVEIIAQPFHPWNGTSMEWCQDKKDKCYGLMLAKVFKTASTTSAGITLRIVNGVGTRQGRHPCQILKQHDFSLHIMHSQ